MDVVRWEPDLGAGGITDGQVDVWLLQLDLENPTPYLLASLSPDERLAAARRSSTIDHRRYAIGRASLRLILGRYLGQPPERLQFRTQAFGRPVLDPPANLAFSVAHAGAVGLVAIARGREVGIDVEPLSAARNIAEIADSYLPPDRLAAIRSGSTALQAEQLVGLWTHLEACAKLDGRGLAALDPTNAAALLDRDVQVVRFVPTIGHLGALAYTGDAADVSYRVLGSGSEHGVGRTPR